MRLVIAMAALVACSGAWADSYLCISDKMILMTMEELTGEAFAGVDDAPNIRLLITQNDAGDYEAGWFGYEHKTLPFCKNFIEEDVPNKLFCDGGTPFNTFVLGKNNTFIAKDINSDVPDYSIHRVIAGKCSAI